MTILAINSSPRKNGNTNFLIDLAFEVLEKEGFKTEKIQIGGQKIRGCLSCFKCRENKNMRCAITDDIVNEVILKISDAEALILGTPVYFANMNTEMKALMDRSGFVLSANGNPLKRKAGAAIIAGRRGGHMQAFNSVNSYFGIMSMFTVGSSYWNIAFGMQEKEVENDEEGKNTIINMAENLAWFLKKTQGI